MNYLIQFLYFYFNNHRTSKLTENKAIDCFLSLYQRLQALKMGQTAHIKRTFWDFIFFFEILFIFDFLRLYYYLNNTFAVLSLIVHGAA